MLRIGVDLGGTKIEAVALDRHDRERLRRRTPTPRGDYEGTISTIVSLVRGFETELGEPGTVGVAMPGAISPATGLAKNANSVWLNGQRFEQDLSSALERPLRLGNDANCLALSEATDGAGAGAAVVFGVIVGTGTGGGIVVRGQILTGVNGIAGEWGHNPLPWPTEDEWPGPKCYCGRTGCVETFLSGPGLAREHEQRTGQRLDAQQLSQLAGEANPDALATFDRYEERLARALASVINVLDPDVIVMGGGMSNWDRLYQRVPELWLPFVFSDRVDTRLVPARHGDSSGVRGAARLWP